MGQEYGERFHRARREDQRLEAALHALTPEEIPEEAEREELLKYIGYRKRSAVQMLIRQGNLPGLKAMDTTAITMCMDNEIPIIAFALDEPDGIKRAVLGEKIGTYIGK